MVPISKKMPREYFSSFHFSLTLEGSLIDSTQKNQLFPSNIIENQSKTTTWFSQILISSKKNFINRKNSARFPKDFLKISERILKQICY
jgi:hypothetical protein